MNFLDWLGQFNITQAFGHNGEQGTDYGVPFHTAVPLAFGGTVKSASYGPWGGLVEVTTTLPGLGKVTEQFIHLDQIASDVTPGAQLEAGHILGLSGGENPGYPGALHPADPKYSSGPHIEFDLKTAAGKFVNPQSVLQSLGGILPLFGGEQGIGQGITPNLQGIGGAFPDMFAAVKNYLTGGVERIAFFAIAMSILMIGIILIVWEPAKEVTVDPVVSAVKTKGGNIKDAAAASVGKAAAAVIA